MSPIIPSTVCKTQLSFEKDYFPFGSSLGAILVIASGRFPGTRPLIHIDKLS